MISFDRITDLIDHSRRTRRIVDQLQVCCATELVLCISSIFFVVCYDGDRLVDVLIRGYSHSVVDRSWRKVFLGAVSTRCLPAHRRL